MESLLHAENLQAIGQNYLRVKESIALAAMSVGRKPEEVKLVVVSKLHSSESIQAAMAAGARAFGENYAEEAVPKINRPARESAHENTAEDARKQSLEWHMIGHIQSRKANLVAEHFDWVQSVDSAKIAERLNSACEGINRDLPVLLEFNLGGEDSKFGWTAQNQDHWSELLPEIRQVVALKRLQVMGLMTMPPLYADPERVRPFFKQLVKLRDFLRLQNLGVEWTELSMGTSNDYEVAIQEGATIVRVGQAILGPRPAR